MSALEDVIKRINNERLRQLLMDAVSHYSPSYAEEPATRVFARALEDAGIPYQRQPVAGGADTGGLPRANLVVRLGPRPTELLWLGHVDTVRAEDEEHAHARVEAGVVHGLGTADMKGGCAAAVEALRALHASGVQLSRGLCVALVVGEEEYGDGTETLLQSVQPSLAVVGEPSGLRPCLKHYGYVEYELEARGARAHAALPEVGSSAVHAMMDWLIEILEARRELPRPEHAAFNPREIQGGSEMFAVAAHCRAALDVHLAPGLGPDLVRQVVEAARESCADEHQGCTLSYSEEFASLGYTLKENDPRLAPLRAGFESLTLPFEPHVFRSQSDATMLHERGCVPLVCGPGQLEVAHTPHEHVALDEVERAARLYAAMFLAVCGG